MNVLVACEFSGMVRDAFIERGHDAISCDLLPSEKPGPHILGDVLDVLNSGGWDLLVAHPPCTYLSVAGNKYFKNNPRRQEKRLAAFGFFMACMNAPIDQICCENPLGYVNSHYRKPDQIIHPYYFGDPFMKRTCLWLKGLPKLYYTANSLRGETMTKPNPEYIRDTGRKKGHPVYWCESLITLPEEERWKARSRTFPGIAKAMAHQWG